MDFALTRLNLLRSASGVGGRLSTARWVNQGETVQIQGTTISSGLFYQGSALPLPDGESTSQYTINPRLPTGQGEGDIAGVSMPYWPSYSSVTADARRAFLNWMAGGRADPRCGLGHVFVFFYGLEHRLFIEGKVEDASAAAGEVRRLLSIYGSNHSFRGYAENFLSCAALLAGAGPSVPNLRPDIGDGSEAPLSVRLHLGAKLALGDRLVASDALLWLLCLPRFHLRTAAVRCFEEFRRLWSVLFDAEFSGGYRVAVPQPRLAIRYRASSGAFEVEIPGPHSRYPDIAAAAQSFDDLKALAEVCTQRLDAFSRFVGKYPDQRASVQAAVLLPEPLRKGAVETVARGLVKRISELMDGKRTAMTDLRDLLAAASIDASASGSALSEAVEQLGKVLDLFDIAIEPDRRYGSGVAQLDDPVVIFAADLGAPIDANKSAYAAMKVRVEVSALAAVSDGNATPDELQSIITTIRADHSLTQIERLRLIAYAVTIFKSPPKQQRILRRLSDTREEERKAIAAAAARVVSSQENADPKSIRFLEKLHKTLKLPVDQVYSDLHRITVDAPVPVTTEQRVPGIRIPKEMPTSTLGDGVRIDNRKLADVQRDTAAVAQILSGIFIDDPHPAEAARSDEGAASSLSGLDADHIQLVIYLKDNGEVDRSDFEEAARALKLLPDGAIERINDWSFDRFDEPLLEDGKCIVLIPHLREKITELNM